MNKKENIHVIYVNHGITFQLNQLNHHYKKLPFSSLLIWPSISYKILKLGGRESQWLCVRDTSIFYCSVLYHFSWSFLRLLKWCKRVRGVVVVVPLRKRFCEKSKKCWSEKQERKWEQKLLNRFWQFCHVTLFVPFTPNFIISFPQQIMLLTKLLNISLFESYGSAM